jgi:hypothetical protein
VQSVTRFGRFGALALVLVAFVPTPAAAEWQIKPFLGLTGGGHSTFVSTDPGGNPPSAVLGASGGWLGEVVGFEGDIGYTPGFFHSGVFNVISGSGVTTLTGNVVIAMPRHLTDYTLRLYFVGGAGMMRVNIEGVNLGLLASQTMPAMDLGGGATGFLTKRIGINWDVRRFRSLGAIDERNSNSPLGPEPFSFWRASMALAIRY